MRKRLPRSLVVGGALLAAMVAIALVGPWLVGSPLENHFQQASRFDHTLSHPLGMDGLYRDQLARVIWGTRTSLVIAGLGAMSATAVGCLVGLLAAWSAARGRGWLDQFFMRVTDVALAFPYLLLVTAIGVAVQRGGANHMIVVFAMTGWVGVAPLMRVAAIPAINAGPARAARALGSGAGRVAWHHVVGSNMGSIAVMASHLAASMMLAEAGLSYLGVGVPPPAPSLGRMLHEAQGYLEHHPEVLAPPALGLFLSVVALVRLGDGIRELEEQKGHRTPPRSSFAVDLAVAGSLLFAVGISAASSPPPVINARPPSHTIQLATAAKLYSLRPATAYHEAAQRFLTLSHSTLVRQDAQGNYVGSLARRFERSHDALSYQFWIRADARHHDGTRVTPHSIKQSLERSLHSKTAAPAASFFSRLRGFDAFRKGDTETIQGIVATKAVLTLELTSPDNTLLALLTLPIAAPTCPTNQPFVDARDTSPPCGAGPYRITKFVPGDHVEFEATDKMVGSPGVRVDFGIPVRGQRHRFDAGKLDVLTEFSTADLVIFGHDPAFTGRRAVLEKPVMEGFFMNTSRAPFDNALLRRAAWLAVDRSTIGRLRETIRPLAQVTPTSIRLSGSHQRTPPPFRLESALEAMAAAGYRFNPATGDGGYPEPIEYLTIPDSFQQSAAEVLQQQLARVGLRIVIRCVGHASLLALRRSKHTQMGWSGWHSDYPHPQSFFQPLLSSEADASTGGTNVSHFSDPTTDRLIGEAMTASVERQAAIYDELETIVAQQSPFVPVYTVATLMVWQPWLRGFKPTSRHPLPLKNAKLVTP